MYSGIFSDRRPEKQQVDVMELGASLNNEVNLQQTRHFALEHRCEALIREFLQVADHQYYATTQSFSWCEAPRLHQAVRACFPELRIVREGCPPTQRAFVLPLREAVAVRPGLSRQVLIEGSHCLDGKHGRRRVATFSISEEFYEREIQLTWIGPYVERRQIIEEWRRLLRWMEKGPHYLRRQAIKPDGTLLDHNPALTWDDVVLEGPVQETVRRHTVEFLDKRKLFRRNKVPQRRGIILFGPPGTGKTLLGMVLAAQARATFILVGSSDMDGPASVTNLFALARRLRPTIVFMEDLDLYGDNRKQNRRPQVLGELMRELDGIETNDGILVIATTNDLNVLEPALVDRPCRFDVLIELGLPHEDSRFRLFRRFLGAASVPLTAIHDAAKLAEGATGAQIREVSVLAVQRAITQERVNVEGVALIEREDLIEAIEKVVGRGKRPIGFAANASNNGVT